MYSDDKAGASAGAGGKAFVGPRITLAAARWTGVARPGSRAPARRDPEADAATLRAIRDMARGGDVDRAGDMAAAALDAGLEHPLLLQLHALKLGAARRFEAAAARLKRLLELEGPEAGVLNALGRCFRELDRPDEALANVDAALALEPGLAEAHGHRAWALDCMGDLKAAEASYRRALELDPACPDSGAGLASLFSRYGDHEAARSFAETVLQSHPDYAPAVMSVAAADLAEGATALAETRLRALLADPRPPPLQKALAKGLLGDVLDAQGRIQAAFEAYTDSGDERRRLYAGRFDGGTLHTARRLAAYFETASPADWTPPAAPRPRDVADAPRAHVFLLGFPRSGTTLLEQALAGHPDVETLSEQEPLADALTAFFSEPSGLDRLAAAASGTLEPYRDSYWRRVRAAGGRPAGKVFVDKHPLNTLKLPAILKLFPDARILLARRDPRDVVLSCFRRRFRMSEPMYAMLTLEGAAAFYAAAMTLAARLHEIAPRDQRVVAHEALVAGFETEMRRICDWLGLAWSDALLDFPTRIRSRAVATPSAAQLARGLNADGVGQWRRYEAQMRPVLPLLQPWVERFGYDAGPDASRSHGTRLRSGPAAA